MSSHAIIKLWVRPVPVEGPVEQASLTLEAGRGVVGDYCFEKHRHVTIVFLDDWNEAAAELGRDVDPAGRHANVLVSGGGGIRFPGSNIRLGSSLIEVRGITHPCNNMENAAPGMMKALDSNARAGIWGRVLESGVLKPGDTLEAEVRITSDRGS